MYAGGGVLGSGDSGSSTRGGGSGADVMEDPATDLGLVWGCASLPGWSAPLNRCVGTGSDGRLDSNFVTNASICALRSIIVGRSFGGKYLMSLTYPVRS